MSGVGTGIDLSGMEGLLGDMSVLIAALPDGAVKSVQRGSYLANVSTYLRTISSVAMGKSTFRIVSVTNSNHVYGFLSSSTKISLTNAGPGQSRIYWEVVEYE